MVGSSKAVSVRMQDGTTALVTKLLTPPRANIKLAKSNKKSDEFVTVGLTLAPANMSGYEVCASRSAGCTKACLVESGKAFFFKNVNRARIAKTRLLYQDREMFVAKLVRDLSRWRKKAAAHGKRLAVRLNVLSDLQWEKMLPELFTTFSDVQFYDYTKHYKRMLAYCAGQLPANYHLTFSRSESNHLETVAVLKRGGSVAVVFESKAMRDKMIGERWNGATVIDGDETDMRFLDGHNVVCGLYAKGVNGKKDDSGFVVRRVALPMA
jgi:hypothetical protein